MRVSATNHVTSDTIKTSQLASIARIYLPAWQWSHLSIVWHLQFLGNNLSPYHYWADHVTGKHFPNRFVSLTYFMQATQEQYPWWHYTRMDQLYYPLYIIRFSLRQKIICHQNVISYNFVRHRLLKLLDNIH